MAHKKLYILPNLFTAASLACGMSAIAMMTQGNIIQACWLILFSTMLDAMDGTVARITRTQSAFGGQFDSLSDMCVFGVAPSLLFYHIFAPIRQDAALLITIAFTLAAAVRLARFNLQLVKKPKHYFQGLPSPGAAIGVVTICLLYASSYNYSNLAIHVLPYVTLLMAALMVSKVPYVSSKYFFRSRMLTLEIFLFAIVYLWLLITMKDIRPYILLGGISIYLMSGPLTALVHWRALQSEHVFDDEEDIEFEDYEEHI